MTLETSVLLWVIVVDALLLGVSLRMRWTVVNNPERRISFLRKLDFQGWLFCLALASFAGYELYRGYELKQFQFAHGSPVIEVSLITHPALFALLGVIYSYAFLIFALGTFLGVAKLFGIAGSDRG
jgi:hypothetical protein